MADLNDLARRGAILVLAALAQKEPLSMGEFTEASNMTFDHARRLRMDLERDGYIEVATARAAGNMKEYEISLTPMGREVAGLLFQITAVLAHHQANHGTSTVPVERAARVLMASDPVPPAAREAWRASPER